MAKFEMKGFPAHRTGMQSKSTVKFNGKSPVLATAQDNQTLAASTSSGAMQGAAAGSMFGPWGMAIGGVVGGVYGYTQGKKANEAAASQALAQQTERKKERKQEHDQKSFNASKEREHQASVGVVQMGSAPPPTSTPVSNQPQDLAKLYSPPITKRGALNKVMEDRQRLINRKK
tara:strand:+ start:1732 stop:2253 length:522 start_codon:yes stop_codon:yes gene_type:complete